MVAVKNVTDYPGFTKFLLVVFGTTKQKDDEQPVTDPGVFRLKAVESNSPSLFAYSEEDELRAHVERLFLEVPDRKDLLILIIKGTKSATRQVILK